MRALLVVIAVALACKRERPVVKADPDEKKHAKVAGVVIRKLAPWIGMHARVTSDSKTVLELTGLTSSPVELTEHEERTEEVLATEGFAVTKVRVTYGAHHTTNSIPGSGAPAKTPSEVSGKTFVVTFTASGLEIEDASGAVVSTGANITIERDYRELGKEDEVSRALPDKPIHVGDAVPAIALAIKAKLDQKATLVTTGDLVVRVDEATPDAVVFGMKGTIGLSAPPMELSVPLTGSISVRVADGRVAEYSFGGPLTIASDAGISGSGSLAFTAKWTYLTQPK